MPAKSSKKRNTPARKKGAPPKGLSAPTGSVMQTAPVSTATVVKKERSRPVTIEMREEVSDVTVFAGKFANSPLIINPANEELFPFLSKLAVHFETFNFERLAFEYAANASSGDAGTVAISVNPNADDPPFEDMRSTLNREGSISGSPWTSLKANGKFKSSNAIGTKFVEDVTGAAALSNILDDLHTIADGVVNVVTAGLNVLGVNNLDVTIDGVPLTVNLDSTVTGKFYVNYKCVLNDPILRETLDEALVTNAFKDLKDPFGDNSSWSENDGLKVAVAYSAVPIGQFGLVATFSFPETGTYMVVWNAEFASTNTPQTVSLQAAVANDGAALVDSAPPVDWTSTAPSQTKKLPSWAVFEILAPNSSIYIAYYYGGVGLPIITGGVVRIAKVNDSTQVLSTLGHTTDSPLDCPKSKGFLMLHHTARQSEGLKAAKLGMLMARSMKSTKSAVGVTVVKKTNIIDRSKVKLRAEEKDAKAPVAPPLARSTDSPSTGVSGAVATLTPLQTALAKIGGVYNPANAPPSALPPQVHEDYVEVPDAKQSKPLSDKETADRTRSKSVDVKTRK